MRAMSLLRSGRWRLILSALVSLLIVAVGTYYALGQLTPKSQPTASAGGIGADKQVISFSSYGIQPKDISLPAKNARVVVLGVVQEVLPATWTTVDGKRPSDAREAFESGLTRQMRTPVRFSVERVFKGDNVPPSIMFSFLGGDDGQVTIRDAQDKGAFKPGARLILFLHEHPPFPNIPSRLFPGLTYIIDGETAHGPDFDVPASELVGQLQRVQQLISAKA